MLRKIQAIPLTVINEVAMTVENKHLPVSVFSFFYAFTQVCWLDHGTFVYLGDPPHWLQKPGVVDFKTLLRYSRDTCQLSHVF